MAFEVRAFLRLHTNGSFADFRGAKVEEKFIILLKVARKDVPYNRPAETGSNNDNHLVPGGGQSVERLSNQRLEEL